MEAITHGKWLVRRQYKATYVDPTDFEKGRITEPRMFVIHSSADNGVARPEAVIDYLRKPKQDSPEGYGYHILIPPEGDRYYKQVPLQNATLHCGSSTGPYGPNCNGYAIAITFVASRYSAPTKAAIKLATQVMREIMEAQWKNITHLSSHHGIAPKRKIDPVGFDPRPVAEELGLIAWKQEGAQWVVPPPGR